MMIHPLMADFGYARQGARFVVSAYGYFTRPELGVLSSVVALGTGIAGVAVRKRLLHGSPAGPPVYLPAFWP